MNNFLHHQKLPINQALQCGAMTRRGKPCRSLVVRGKRRCRMHGGAAGSGAPVGNKNALRHRSLLRRGHRSSARVIRADQARPRYYRQAGIAGESG